MPDTAPLAAAAAALVCWLVGVRVRRALDEGRALWAGACASVDAETSA